MRACAAFPIRVVRTVALALVFPLALRMLAAQSPPLPLLPNGVAYDSAGNLYFADTNRHQVYESSLAGVLTVVAGNGAQGFGGDGNAATNAQLNAPEGVAIGPDGTLYIADTGNQRIRAVIAGQITTFAGNGLAGFSGDGASALAATFRNPTALAMDLTGALLVCDSANHRLRRIANGIVTTIASSNIQGFAGDGALATAAALDTPSGLAAGSDGRIYVADAHNDRIRVIATDGTITTFAGNGKRGYSGDGNAALTTALALPHGLVITPSGSLLVADSDNHRLRMIDANGNITTIAGTGVQGSSLDGSTATTVALNTPRGVTVSTFGSPVLADAMNHLVREGLTNGNLYLPAGLAAGRVSTVSLSVPPTQTYGQDGATATVTGVAPPLGAVQLLDQSSVVAETMLLQGTATFPPGLLNAGTHTLSAAFPGDGVNPAATSAPSAVAIAPALLTATATPQTIEYGQTIPALTGSLTGVLPQDIGDVTALYNTTAVLFSPPATYPITATLTGSASSNYSVLLGPASGSLKIDLAATLTTEEVPAASTYAGFPLMLTATVASTTQGTPTGTVAFTDSGTQVATATLANGVASASYLSPSSGTHSLVASYHGDGNYKPSSSAPAITTVGTLPDFTITVAGSSTDTISSGGVGTYTVMITSQSAPFTGVVDLSAAGLPSGATAIFSPPQVVPGTGSATVTISVQTASIDARASDWGKRMGLLSTGLLLPFLPLTRRRKRSSFITYIFASLLLFGTVGCGARSITTAFVAKQIYYFQVTGTATNLAGTLITHSVPLTLVVQ